VHFLCVGTPQKKGELAADMTYVDAAFTSLIPHARAGSLLVGKSTVPAGRPSGWPSRSPRARATSWSWRGTRSSSGGLRRRGHPHPGPAGVRRPERSGRAAAAGGVRAGARRPTPVVVTDFATAQLVKVAANAFLATKISFINAMAEVCEATGGDVTLLSKALSYDTRIGGRFLHAGLGFGGGCLPKDIRAFMARAGELGVDQALSFLKEVDAINLRRRARMIDLARELVGGSFGGMRVAVLGAAFKPNSDDIRDSPALDVAASIQKQGAAVTCTTRRRWTTPGSSTPSWLPRQRARGREGRRHRAAPHRVGGVPLDGPRRARRGRRRPRIVDGRNALDPAAWRAAGWTYRALGRP
jgi:UDPglucose 6-dehydrogenase